MPTPTGKPRKGESIYTKDGQLIGTVTQRSDGNCYSVWVKKPNQRQISIITEFEYWQKLHGWEIR